VKEPNYNAMKEPALTSAFKTIFDKYCKIVVMSLNDYFLF